MYWEVLHGEMSFYGKFNKAFLQLFAKFGEKKVTESLVQLKSLKPLFLLILELESHILATQKVPWKKRTGLHQLILAGFKECFSRIVKPNINQLI